MFNKIIANIVKDATISDLLCIDKVNAKIDAAESILDTRLQNIELGIAELEEEHDRKSKQLAIARKARAALAKIFD